MGINLIQCFSEPRASLGRPASSAIMNEASTAKRFSSPAFEALHRKIALSHRASIEIGQASLEILIDADRHIDTPGAAPHRYDQSRIEIQTVSRSAEAAAAPCQIPQRCPIDPHAVSRRTTGSRSACDDLRLPPGPRLSIYRMPAIRRSSDRILLSVVVVASPVHALPIREAQNVCRRRRWRRQPAADRKPVNASRMA